MISDAMLYVDANGMGYDLGPTSPTSMPCGGGGTSRHGVGANSAGPWVDMEGQIG